MTNILLIEDDPFLLDIYRKKLKDVGFSLEIAENGGNALDAINNKDFDVILLDIVLPEIDGWDILRKITKESRNQNSKIIILSNLGQKEEVEKGLKMGAVKYLIKAQFTPSQVVDEIKATLKT